MLVVDDEDLRTVGGARRCKPDRSSELAVNMVDEIVSPFAMQHPMDPVVEVVIDQEIYSKLTTFPMLMAVVDCLVVVIGRNS